MMYSLTDDYVWKEIGRQVVVLHYESGAYWTLNDTASLIWRSILEGQSPDEVAQRLEAEFSAAPGSAKTDVQEFIQGCLEKKMLLPT